jgi:hypothetical protein
MAEKTRAERMASGPTGEEIKALKAYSVDVTYSVYHSLTRIVLAADAEEAAELARSNPWADDVSLVQDVDHYEGEMSSEHIDTDPEELTVADVMRLLEGEDTQANGVNQWLLQHGVKNPYGNPAKTGGAS